jgi:hypothetical protein
MNTCAPPAASTARADDRPPTCGGRLAWLARRAPAGPAGAAPLHTPQGQVHSCSLHHILGASRGPGGAQVDGAAAGGRSGERAGQGEVGRGGAGAHVAQRRHVQVDVVPAVAHGGELGQGLEVQRCVAQGHALGRAGGARREADEGGAVAGLQQLQQQLRRGRWWCCLRWRWCCRRCRRHEAQVAEAEAGRPAGRLRGVRRRAQPHDGAQPRAAAAERRSQGRLAGLGQQHDGPAELHGGGRLLRAPACVERRSDGAAVHDGEERLEERVRVAAQHGGHVARLQLQLGAEAVTERGHARVQLLAGAGRRAAGDDSAAAACQAVQREADVGTRRHRAVVWWALRAGGAALPLCSWKPTSYEPL